MKEAHKSRRADLGIPPAKLDENPYGEAQRQAGRVVLPSVPTPSKKQMGDVARERLKNEIEQRHSSRGRVLPRELVSRLEKNALRIYEEARNSASRKVDAAEKEKGFELTSGQKIKIFREEYSFALLREMDAYYRPEAEKRVDALVKTLGGEDRKALGKGKLRDELVSQMARRLALNPSESMKAGEVRETLLAVDKMARTVEEMYGKDAKWIPMEKLEGRAMEIYRGSRESARREIARIEGNGGHLSAGQRIIMWELEYRKMVHAEVKRLGRGQG